MQQTNRSEKAQKMLVGRLSKELERKLGIFDGASVEKEYRKYCTSIKLSNHESNMLTFAEIDTARVIVKKYADKYGENNIYAVLTTEPYPVSIGGVSDWLSRPVMEVFIWNRGEA